MSAEQIHLNVFTRKGTIMLFVSAGGLTVVTCVLQLEDKKKLYCPVCHGTEKG